MRDSGDPFEPAAAARLLRRVHSRGGAVDPAEAFRRFRSRDAKVAPLLEKRGLTEEAQPA